MIAGRSMPQMAHRMRKLARLAAAFDADSGQFVRIRRALHWRRCKCCRIFCARIHGTLCNGS
ncbi:hypothetical protein METH_00210 [Leisingera methylohalidivorans DSM 14336]|uniref:Uncharacterized protein n=1 Tax=Leisingera methylohalidivorans DSM 14336 TaxID=999552 RepID=V9VY05_9RHOB|nr:hypothetical protein METH_00210 [Leisingera methylohalidivorans DSM 14336]